MKFSSLAGTSVRSDGVWTSSVGQNAFFGLTGEPLARECESKCSKAAVLPRAKDEPTPIGSLLPRAKDFPFWNGRSWTAAKDGPASLAWPSPQTKDGQVLNGRDSPGQKGSQRKVPRLASTPSGRLPNRLSEPLLVATGMESGPEPPVTPPRRDTFPDTERRTVPAERDTRSSDHRRRQRHRRGVRARARGARLPPLPDVVLS